MQTERSHPESFLAATTPRDVLKTLIQGYIQHQVAGHQQLAPKEREALVDELTREAELERDVDDLIKTDTAQREVPIQAGFGIGAPPSSVDQN